MNEIILGAVIAATTSIITAFVTSYLSLNKERSQTLWALKMEAYKDVVNALHHIKKKHKKYINRELNIHGLSQAYIDEMSKNSKEAYNYLEMTADSGKFFLSDQACQCIERFLDNLPQYQEDNFLNFLEESFSHAESCLTEFHKIAKKDLR